MTSAHATQLKGIRDIASLINAGIDLATILERIVYAVCQHTSWSIAGIMKVNLETGYSERVARFDPFADPERKLPTRWKLTTSPALRVAETRTPFLIEDAQQCAEFPDYRRDALDRGYRTVVILPLGATDAENREMVLSVQSRAVIAVEEPELAFLATIAHLAGIAVEKAKRLEEGRAIAERLERTLEINASLLERALAGGPMETITGMVETLLAEPLVIVDLMAQSLIARRSPAPEALTDAEWRKFVRGKGARLFFDQVRQAPPSDFSDRTTLDLAPGGVALRLPAMIEPLQVDGGTVGGLVIFPRAAARDELDRLLAQEAKLALSVQLLRAYVQFRSHADSLSALLRELFQGVAGEGSEIVARAEGLGLDLTRPVRLIAIGLAAGPPGEGAGDAPPPVHQAFPRALHRALAELAARQWPGAAVALRGADLVLLAPGAGEDDGRRVAALARLLAEEITRSAGGMPAIAPGPLCRRLQDYPRAWAECARLLTLARSFGRTGIVSPETFGPFADLLSSLDGAAIRGFVARILGAVESYDSQHGAKLLETVQAFIDTGCRYKSCARRLGIHVSTLRYRVEQLRARFGTDLESAECRFALALALRLRDIARDRAEEPEFRSDRRKPDPLLRTPRRKTAGGRRS